jgi:mono/diheme cytochrome c family protein
MHGNCNIYQKLKLNNMKTFKKTLAIIASALIYGCLVTFNAGAQDQQVKPWEVPDEYKSMKNPVTQGDESNKAGQALYVKNCASCHGKTGLGDGVKSRMLKDFAGDFSSDYFQNQTDGEHFYKTKFGRGEMPKYDGKLSDDDIWNIINYMRTFKK